MDNNKKLSILIDLLPLIPLVAKGVTEAVGTFNKMADALKEGNITDEELADAIAERDDILDRIISKTQED